jgi:SAM-dependent methyltransferase
MRLFEAAQSREQYLATQVARSQAKFGFCKVSARDIATYHRVIAADAERRGVRELGPVLCLGTRNGREIDLFRLEFVGPAPARLLTRLAEVETSSLASLLPPVEALGRSDVRRLDARSVVGVEINPAAARSDVWTGSFDEMPAAWKGTFGVVFSNSFDQAQDPARTAAEWRRIIRPGGYLVFCFAPGAVPTQADPVGDLRLGDALSLFGGTLVYFHERGSRMGYSQVILHFGEG